MRPSRILFVLLLISACALPRQFGQQRSGDGKTDKLRPGVESCAQWAERRVTNELEQKNAFSGLRLDGENYEASTRRWDATKRIRALTLHCERMKDRAPK